MRTPFVVALYGRSLILSSVGRQLAQREGTDVVTVEGPDVATAIASLAPDVLMVDLQAVDIPSALALVEAHPDLLVVGLEPSGARLVALAGRHARTMTTDELVALIGRRADVDPHED